MVEVKQAQNLQPLETQLAREATAKTDYTGSISLTDAKEIIDGIKSKGTASPDDVAAAVADLGKRNLVSPQVAQIFRAIVSLKELPSNQDPVTFSSALRKAAPVVDQYIERRANLVGAGATATTVTEKNQREQAIYNLDGAARNLAAAKPGAATTTAANALQKALSGTQGLGAIGMDSVTVNEESFWAKAGDVFLEIISLGIHDTQLFNGRVDVAAWQTKGRELITGDLGPALQARYAEILGEKEGDVAQTRAQLKSEITDRLEAANVKSNEVLPNHTTVTKLKASAEEFSNIADALTAGIIYVAVTKGSTEVPAPKVTTTKLDDGTPYKADPTKPFAAYHEARAKLVAELQTLNQTTNQAKYLVGQIKTLDANAKYMADNFGKDPGTDKVNGDALAAAIGAAQTGHMPAAVPTPPAPAPATPPKPEWKAQIKEQTDEMHTLLGKNATQDDVAQIQQLLLDPRIGKALHKTFTNALGKTGPHNDGVDGVAGPGFKRALNAALAAAKLTHVPADQRLQALSQWIAKMPAAAAPAAKAAHPSVQQYAAVMHPNKVPAKKETPK